MGNVRSVTGRSLIGNVVVPGVLVVALLIGMGGTAGAKSPTASVATPTAKAAVRAAEALGAAERHFNCTDASQAINAVQQLRNKFAANLAGLKAAQAQAAAKATTLTNPRRKAFQDYLASFFGRRIVKTERHQAHVLSPHFLAREARLAKIAHAKCG